MSVAVGDISLSRGGAVSHVEDGRNRTGEERERRWLLAGGHGAGPWCGFPGPGYQTKVAVRIRPLCAVDRVPWPYRYAARWVKTKIELGCALCTKPEEFDASRSASIRIEIACIQQSELFTTAWIDAPLDHQSAPRNARLQGLLGSNCDRNHRS